MPSTDFTIHLSIPRGTPPSPGVDRAMGLRLPNSTMAEGHSAAKSGSGRLGRRVSDHSRDTPVTSQPIAHVVLPGGLPVWIRTPHGTLDVRAGSGRSPVKL